MADEGTLAATAEVLLAIGHAASSEQILEANTNTWVKWAEGDIAVEMQYDVVANYSAFSLRGKRFLSSLAANRAAFYAINQNQSSWSLPITQSKLNVINDIWQSGLKIIRDTNRQEFMKS
jgi:hypothetical protein